MTRLPPPKQSPRVGYPEEYGGRKVTQDPSSSEMTSPGVTQLLVPKPGWGLRGEQKVPACHRHGDALLTRCLLLASRRISWFSLCRQPKASHQSGTTMLQYHSEAEEEKVPGHVRLKTLVSARGHFCPERWETPHPWESWCSGWTGLWATLSAWRCWRLGGPWKVLSNLKSLKGFKVRLDEAWRSLVYWKMSLLI